MYSITEAAPLDFETFKRGREGWPVIACQIALNSHYKTPPLTLDGVFGPATERVAKEVQSALGITQDGIVGPETQEAFVKAKCKHAEKATTPPGLLAGLCDIESSYSWPCVSPLNSNGTHDYGVTQWSLLNPTAQQLLAAFNPDASAHVLAGEVVGFYQAVVAKVGNRRAWELAALNHNWPAAAWALAEGNEAWLDKPFSFTTAKGYSSGLAYADHYVQVSTAQVTSWKVV
jgi:hypothetical protein